MLRSPLIFLYLRLNFISYVFYFVYIVISKPKGPSSTSEYEHSSIPATIKRLFNLSSNFLTHRDAWAGTFEQVVGELATPRTDCTGNKFFFGKKKIIINPIDCRSSEFSIHLVLC